MNAPRQGPLWTEGESMKTKQSESIDEIQIRHRIDGWAKALRAKDIDGIMSSYAPEVLVFDIAPHYSPWG